MCLKKVSLKPYIGKHGGFGCLRVPRTLVSSRSMSFAHDVVEVSKLKHLRTGTSHEVEGSFALV